MAARANALTSQSANGFAVDAISHHLWGQSLRHHQHAALICALKPRIGLPPRSMNFANAPTIPPKTATGPRSQRQLLDDLILIDIRRPHLKDVLRGSGEARGRVRRYHTGRHAGADRSKLLDPKGRGRASDCGAARGVQRPLNLFRLYKKKRTAWGLEQNRADSASTGGLRTSAIVIGNTPD